MLNYKYLPPAHLELPEACFISVPLSLLSHGFPARILLPRVDRGAVV